MNPSEIARETLKRLAIKRTPPTPDNYRMLYHEISGTDAAEIFPEKSLKALVNSLPQKTPEQTRYKRQIDHAIASKSWGELKNTLSDLLVGIDS